MTLIFNRFWDHFLFHPFLSVPCSSIQSSSHSFIGIVVLAACAPLLKCFVRMNIMHTNVFFGLYFSRFWFDGIRRFHLTWLGFKNRFAFRLEFIFIYLFTFLCFFSLSSLLFSSVGILLLWMEAIFSGSHWRSKRKRRRNIYIYICKWQRDGQNAKNPMSWNQKRREWMNEWMERKCWNICEYYTKYNVFKYNSWITKTFYFTILISMAHTAIYKHSGDVCVRFARTCKVSRHTERYCKLFASVPPLFSTLSLSGFKSQVELSRTHSELRAANNKKTVIKAPTKKVWKQKKKYQHQKQHQNENIQRK